MRRVYDLSGTLQCKSQTATLKNSPTRFTVARAPKNIGALVHLSCHHPLSAKWTKSSLEEDMVIAAHLLCPGDEKERCWIGEVFLVKEGGSEPLFTWGNDPLTNG